MLNVKEKLKNLVGGKGNAKAAPEKHATGIDLELINAKTAEETKRLIAAGADVNAKDWYGRTALMKAQTAEQTKLLIDAGADVNAKDKGDYAPLISIEVGGRTALMKAQTAEQTKLLIAAGANVNAKDDYGYTALMEAKTAEQTKLLITAGADVNAKNKYKGTALKTCCEHMYNTGFFLACGLRKTPEEAYSEKAARYPSTVEQMKMLIDAGADVNAKDEYGRTALHYALYERQTAMQKIKMLIAAGADVNAEDKGGKTPLMRAKTAEQMQVLIDAGADVYAKDKEGYGVAYYSRFGWDKSNKEKTIKEAMAKTPKPLNKSLLAKIADKLKGFNR